MAKRYRVAKAFAVYVNGTPRVFTPDYIDPRTKLLGYGEDQLKGLSKDARASFVPVEDDGGDDVPVERATAAPGEKRTVKRTKSTKAAKPAAAPSESVTDAADTA